MKRGGPTNCDECLPALFPENLQAVEVYNMVCSQFIMSFGGVVDINILSVIEYMKMLDISDDTDTFKKVISACRARIKTINEESEEKRG